MAFYVKYRCEFSTIKGRNVRIDIEEDDFPQLPLTYLTASSQSPLEIIYANGEFDKMCPIRESKIRFKFISKDVTYENFQIDFDTQYKVKIYFNGVLEWLGWLDNDIINQTYVDTYTEIQITANDGLSFLKNFPLSDISNQEMWGLFRIKNYIASCLHKTFLNLNFYSFINILPYPAFDREFSTPSSNDWDAFFYGHLNAFTFMTGARQFDDCYMVLSKILQSFGCTLFQSRGSWYIVQTNDRIAGDLDATLRDFNGNPLSIILNQNWQIDIGLNKSVKLINADALVSSQKPFKEIKVTHDVDVPEVYFRNFDLLDLGTKSSNPTQDWYDPLHWRSIDIIFPVQPSGYVDVGFIEVVKDSLGNDIGRELIFPGGTTNNPAGGKCTQIFPVTKGEVINFGYEISYTISYNEWGDHSVFVLHYDTGASIFRWLDQTGEWVAPQRRVTPTWNNNEDRTIWKTYNIKSKPVPFDGWITLVVTGRPFNGIKAGLAFNVYFRNLQFSIDKVFDDSFAVSGFEYKNIKPQNIRNKFDIELFISNSRNYSTKGTLLNNQFVLSNLWTYKTNAGTRMPFSKLISRLYYKTMHRSFKRLEGRLYNIYINNNLLSLLNTIIFETMPDEEFMITSLNIDVRQESAEFTSIELKNITNSNDFNAVGSETFRFIEESAKNENNPRKKPKRPVDYRFGGFGHLSELISRNRNRNFNNL